MEIDIHEIVRQAEQIPGWMTPNELTWLVKKASSLPEGAAWAELGSFCGRSLLAVGLALPDKSTLVSVDNNWQKREGNEIALFDVLRQINSKRKEQIKVHAICSTTDEACEWCRALSFDVVFIDANHSYEFCRRDIQNWRRLLKPGGTLCGHDYGREAWKGVTKSVDELLPDHNIYETIWSFTNREKTLEKQSCRSIDKAPIVLGIRYHSDWLAGENQFKLHWIKDWPERMIWWSEVFSMPYNLYRNSLQQIARRNWSRIEGLDSIVCLHSWPPEFFHDAIIIPIDDDDWLDPGICRFIRGEVDEQLASVSWRSERAYCLNRYAMHLYGQADSFMTNGYALTPKYREIVGNEQYQTSLKWHNIAADHAKESNLHSELLLGAAPCSWASITNLIGFDSCQKMRESAKSFSAWHNQIHPLDTTAVASIYTQEYQNLYRLNEDLLKGIK